MRDEHFELHAAIEARHWWFVGRRAVVRALVRELAPPRPGGTVVDVGCGTGGNVAAFAKEYRAVGVDPSARAIEAGRRRFPRVEFVEGDARTARETLREASVVLLMDVLEHVTDDRGLLAGIVERMEPGGHLVVTVPAGPELWSAHDVSFGHVRRYTPEMLEALVRPFPLEARLLSYFNTRLFPLARAVRSWSRRRGAALGPAGTDLATPPPPLNWVLARTFAGEARRLRRVLAGKAPPYGAGLSLIAVLKRLPG